MQFRWTFYFIFFNLRKELNQYRWITSVTNIARPWHFNLKIANTVRNVKVTVTQQYNTLSVLDTHCKNEQYWWNFIPTGNNMFFAQRLPGQGRQGITRRMTIPQLSSLKKGNLRIWTHPVASSLCTPAPGETVTSGR